MPNNLVEYDRPNSQELVSHANDFLEMAKTMVINSPSMYSLAAEELATIKGNIAALTERRMGITRKFDDLKKDIMDLFRPALDRLEEAKTYHQNGMITYNAEVEHIRKAEQDRLEAIVKAEKDQLKAEARAVEAAAAKAISEAKGKAAKEQARIAAENAQEEADAIRMTAQVVVAAPATTVAPSAAGTSVRKVWKGKCTDKLALVKYIAEHPEYIELVGVDPMMLNSIARAQKENMKLPGCEAYQEAGITSRKK